MYQDWILKAMQYVIAAHITTLEELMDGKAYVDVHTYAMASLIFRTEAINAEHAPETLLFDVNRIRSAQGTANYFAVGCTMIVMIQHEFTRIKKEKLANKAEYSETQIRFLDSALGDITDEIVKGDNFTDFTTKLCEKLDIIHELTNSAERAKFVRVLSSAIENPMDAVRNLM